MKFSSRIRGPLAPNDFFRAVEIRRGSNATMWDLSIANPTLAELEYPLEEIRAALGDSAKSMYQPDPRGLLAARSAVAGYYHERGIALSPEHVVLTSGTSEAYGLLFKLLCSPGKSVLYPKPSYPLIPLLAELEGAAAKPYALSEGDWRWDPSALFESWEAEVRAVVAVSPNNPTGSMLTERELRELSGFCAAHRTALVVDEVFLDYPSPARAGSVVSAAGNPDTLTFTLGGLSKSCGLPQMKLAWIAVSGPGRAARTALARLEFIADAYLTVGTPVQQAAPVLLMLGGGVREQIRRRVDANEETLREMLGDVPGVTLFPRDGGWYSVIRLPDGTEDEKFALRLLEEQGVIVQPGYLFDFEDAQAVVVSLLTPAQTFDEGTVRMSAALRNQTGR
ncbi:MAG: pyridoxal phosphate-dependent aminotransferase [Anaerolineales bacterium]|nr:pyridoxal phosphate-dependent aminotransferase [Anaerolineales bacterium]